ncbi:MAG: hypothetical protein EXS31_19125 [Pedosphaera sp.]|nr:hypothetical protein [Pedosphaera sp.]
MLSAAILFLSTGCSKPPAPDISGYWLGKITVNEITLTLGLDIAKAAGGKHTATFDSIDQGARDIPVAEITYLDGTLHLGMKALAASYDGKVDSTGKRINGTWSQLKMSTPLVWERAQKLATPDMSAVDKNFEPRAGSEIQGLWKGGTSYNWTRVETMNLGRTSYTSPQLEHESPMEWDVVVRVGLV